ncbi:hypothetical protein JHK86_055445 [Glycine max]|nr:hypothetical protein JHK86_055445 [Glycine max]
MCAEGGWLVWQRRQRHQLQGNQVASIFRSYLVNFLILHLSLSEELKYVIFRVITNCWLLLGVSPPLNLYNDSFSNSALIETRL